MATTVSSAQDYVNQYIRDTTNNSVTAADRLRAITEAVRHLYNEFDFDFANRTYELSFFDSVTTYDITTAVPDYLETVDLRRASGRHVVPFTRKTAREIAVEIDEGASEDSFALETINQKNYLVINAPAKYAAKTLHDCDTYDSNGTWTADAVNGDAENVATDTNEYKQGSGAVSFDVDTTNTAQNKARIYISDMSEVDLSDEENLGSFLAWVYIPSITEFSSITVYWGSSSSAYWSATVTTDYMGVAFVAGWNRIKVAWSSTSKTSTPDSSAINFLQFDFNYTASYASQTDFRIDEILMVKPETLTFHYQTWYVGKSNAGAYLYAFTATTDIPFYSGIYDYFDVYVGHMAAATLLREMGLRDDAAEHEMKSEQELKLLRRKMPSSRLTPTSNFKVKGLSWNK